jgi:hypothetical protein
MLATLTSDDADAQPEGETEPYPAQIWLIIEATAYLPRVALHQGGANAGGSARDENRWSGHFPLCEGRVDAMGSAPGSPRMGSRIESSLIDSRL